MHKQALIYAAVFLLGVVLNARVRALPVVGSKIPAV
jgi:hypothetical protein